MSDQAKRLRELEVSARKEIRRKAAIDIGRALVQTPEYVEQDPERIARRAIAIADALIELLEEGL